AMASIDTVNIIGVKGLLEKRRTPARIYIDPNSNKRTILMDKQRLEELIAGRNTGKELAAAQSKMESAKGTDGETTALAELDKAKAAAGAYDRAKQNLTHEIAHTGKKGKSETWTAFTGVAV